MAVQRRRNTLTTNAARCVATLIVLAVFATSAHAQRVDLERLDAYFAQAGSAWQVPGFAIAIVKDDAVVFAKGYGVRELGQQEEVDEHTLFAIASNSKAFTSAALAKLVDEGKLSWTDRVIDHLPYFEVYSPFVTQEMRVRDLLSHRSGLGHYSGDLVWYGTSYTREEVVRRIRHLQPAGEFRADYGYSNVMFVTAGLIIPAVTGKSWDEYLETEFFDPLGMERTVTSIDSLSNRSNVATPHGERNGRVMAFPWYSWDNVGPAGSIISSVSEMALWIRLRLNRGTWDGRTYFSAEQSRTMWTPHISFGVSAERQERYPSVHFRSYGLGWSLMDYRGRMVARHGGAADGMFSQVVLVPEENLGMVILTNSMTSMQTALSYRVLDAYLGGEERDWSSEDLVDYNRGKEQWAERWAEWESERIPNTQPSLRLEQYGGAFGGALYGDATVELEDGALVLRLLPNPDLVGDLTHWHHDTFLIEWRREFPWFDDGWAQFVLGRNGKVVELKLDVPNEDFWFTELEFKKLTQER